MSSERNIICVLGCPGAGKGTLCTRLTQEFAVLHHFSVGDHLRGIRDDPNHPQAEFVKSMLSNQELITPNVLVPIIKEQLEKLKLRDPTKKAILLDGFPRDMAQLKEFEEKVGNPSLVLLFSCSKDIAKQRYLTRDVKRREMDDETLFEKRHKEYTQKNAGIESIYRDRGVLVEVDTSGEENQSWETLRGKLDNEAKWTNIISF